VKLRTSFAIIAGRVAGAASRALGRGGGTAVGGLVAQQVDQGLVERLAAQLGRGSIIVTGTNGKTTTSSMIAAIAREAGFDALANPTGSNLMRGIATALLGESSASGRVREAERRLGVFEVDEATLPDAARSLAPGAIVFTNLFRDQLDRYGEVDTVARLWKSSVETLHETTTLVLGVDDPAVASLAEDARGQVLTFGIEDARVAGETVEHASDYRFCLSCGEELSYEAIFYGHVGHWRCEQCGNARPRPDVRATCVELGDASADIVIETREGELKLSLPLAGLYNVENALAATAGALALGLPLEAVERALASFSAAFGRQERFTVDGREVLVMLGKNPTGMNQVLRTITTGDKRDLHMLLFLNDGVADGRDISWIWDTDYELLAGRAASVGVSGTRAEELALRLKYAGFDGMAVDGDAKASLERALATTPAGETLHIVPTYTAMLNVRELLAKRGGKSAYWEAP
jgi:UDP-N-acetylmuramyl tripeptide synthase